MADPGKSFGTGFESGIGLAIKDLQRMRLEELREKKVIEREKRKEIDRLAREVQNRELKALANFAKTFTPPKNIPPEEWENPTNIAQRETAMRTMIMDISPGKKINPIA